MWLMEAPFVHLYNMVLNHISGYDLASHLLSLGRSSFCDATNSPTDKYCEILEDFLRDSYDSLVCVCSA